MEVMEEVRKSIEVLSWLIFGGIGGGTFGYCKGHSDGYRKAKCEDMPYIRALENENSRLRSEEAKLITELWQERRAKAEIQREIGRLRKEIQPSISST